MNHSVKYGFNRPNARGSAIPIIKEKRGGAQPSIGFPLRPKPLASDKGLHPLFLHPRQLQNYCFVRGRALILMPFTALLSGIRVPDGYVHQGGHNQSSNTFLQEVSTCQRNFPSFYCLLVFWLLPCPCRRWRQNNHQRTPF